MAKKKNLAVSLLHACSLLLVPMQPLLAVRSVLLALPPLHTATVVCLVLLA